MTIQEQLEQEAVAEERRERAMKRVIMLAGLIVFALIVYGMSRPEPKMVCDPDFAAAAQKQGNGLLAWGGCKQEY